MNNISKKEIRWCTIKYNDKTEFVITSDILRTVYYIYSHDIKNNTYTKLGKSKNPICLEEKYIKW